MRVNPKADAAPTARAKPSRAGVLPKERQLMISAGRCTDTTLIPPSDVLLNSSAILCSVPGGSPAAEPYEDGVRSRHGRIEGIARNGRDES
jgi:hypothetical protein